jgi:hypothetical protein
MLFDREAELEELDFIPGEAGRHFLMVSGRRRHGKTTLLVDWVQRVDVPAIYWVASRVSAAQLLRSFSQTVYNHLQPEKPTLAIPPGRWHYSKWQNLLGRGGLSSSWTNSPMLWRSSHDCHRSSRMFGTSRCNKQRYSW